MPIIDDRSHKKRVESEKKRKEWTDLKKSYEEELGELEEELKAFYKNPYKRRIVDDGLGGDGEEEGDADYFARCVGVATFLLHESKKEFDALSESE